jgi:hypothetical protein
MKTVGKFDDCKAMSGTPRPSGLRKLHSKNGLGQATGANALVVAIILLAEFIEEISHLGVLVLSILIARKVCREAAPGDVICDLHQGVGCFKLRTTDTSDPGTCKITTVW